MAGGPLKKSREDLGKTFSRLFADSRRVPRRRARETLSLFFGNGPNTVSGSTVSNTELSELFSAH